jgi:hypothetical protein
LAALFALSAGMVKARVYFTCLVNKEEEKRGGVYNTNQNSVFQPLTPVFPKRMRSFSSIFHAATSGSSPFVPYYSSTGSCL